MVALSVWLNTCMMQHIKIHTDFDITNTGVVRKFNASNLPCIVGGKTISTETEWLKLRRQQANWETFVQLISLRAQPLNIHTVVNKFDWTLEFDVETKDVYMKNGDLLGLLKEDFENIPLLTGLDEKKDLEQPNRQDYPLNVRFETYES